jgi:hypothetical protein
MSEYGAVEQVPTGLSFVMPTSDHIAGRAQRQTSTLLAAQIYVSF